jgi:tetratricopeptide (TPR) repeat protein
MTFKPPLLLTAVLLFHLCFSLGLAIPQADEAAIRRYSRQAEEAMARKDANAAISALEKLAGLTPNNPEVHANLGAVYYAQGRYAEAGKAFERAVRLNPNIPNGRLMLALCEAEVGRGKEALPVLERGYRNPPDPEMGRMIGLKLATVYSSLGQQPKAIEVMEGLLERNPNDPEILYRASHLYADRALATMTRLAEVAPKSVWRNMAYGEALEEEKRYDLATVEYRKVIATDPGISGVHYRLGRVLLLESPDNDQARTEALAEFQRELTIEPRNAAAEYQIGEIYRRRGDLASAIDHLSKAVAINPKIGDAQIALARTLIQFKKPQDSVPHLLAAIEVNPQNEVPHFLLARAYRLLGDTAGYQRETTLYQKYHVQPYADKPQQDVQTLTAPDVPRQTLDSGTEPQP